MASGSFTVELVRRTAGTGDDEGGDDAIGGGVGGTGGNAAAAVGLDEALPSGLWLARKKVTVTVHSAMTPMSATESQLLADFAFVEAAVACGVPLDRASSHVATI